MRDGFELGGSSPGGGGAHQPGPGGGPVHPGHAARLLFTNGRPRGGHTRGCAGPALRGGAARGARAQGATRRAGAARRRARHPEPARGAAGAAPHLLLPVRRARVRVPGEGGRKFTKNKNKRRRRARAASLGGVRLPACRADAHRAPGCAGAVAGDHRRRRVRPGQHPARGPAAGRARDARGVPPGGAAGHGALLGARSEPCARRPRAAARRAAAHRRRRDHRDEQPWVLPAPHTARCARPASAAGPVAGGVPRGGARLGPGREERPGRRRV